MLGDPDGHHPSAAARSLLVLKKVDAIWGDEDDDMTPKSDR